MNVSEQEIENWLRRAPQPKAPMGLRKQLLADVRLPRAAADSQPNAASPGFTAWLRRWWPALAPAAASLACAAVLTTQRAEIRDLNESIRVLSETPANEIGTATSSSANPSATPSGAALREQEQIARLKEQAARLAAEIARLEEMQTENAGLRQQLAAPAGFRPEELEGLDALAKARERAMAIACVNNLKQIGLAARIWANDNHDVSPPDLLSMSNELNTPKILVCPADTNRAAAVTFAKYTDANCSYEFLTPSATNADYEPERVMTRCPIHGTIGLCDGSVQMGAAKTHPEMFVERNGKLYFGFGPTKPAQPKP
jgi:hypothetical protein